MKDTNRAVTDSGAAPSELGKIQVQFESVSGQSLGLRFNTLKRYYAKCLGANTGDWVAQRIKESLISNIHNGTIIVTVSGKTVGMA